MAENKPVSRSLYFDTASAQKAYDDLIEKQRMLTAKIDEGKKSGKSMVDEIAKLDKVKNDIAQVKDALDKGLAPSLKEQETLVRKLRNELRLMSADAPGYAQKFSVWKSANKDLHEMRSRFSAVESANNKFSEGLKTTSKYLIGLAAAKFSAEAIIGFFTDAVHEASEAEQATQRFQSILDNVGRSDAFDRLISKADEMQQTFKYIDNDDVVGVFEKLITYGKLTERQINDLTPVIIDFAAKQKISLEESASVMIKALEGNAKALKEYGINIKEGGSLTERFGILMTDLKGRVDGAGEAFGKTFAGQVAIARQEIKDAQEEIGQRMLPVLAKLLTALSEGIKGIGSIASFAKNYFVSGGSSFTARAMNNLELIMEADAESAKKRTEEIINSVKNDSKGRERSTKDMIEAIKKSNEFDENQLAWAKATGDAKKQMTYEKLIADNLRSIKFLEDKINPELDKVLGIGDPSGNGEKGPTAKEIEALQSRFNELISMLNQTARKLDLSPMELEFLKINDLLAKQIREIENMQEKGAISAKQAEEAIKLARLAAQVSSDEAYNKDQAAADKRRAGANVVLPDSFKRPAYIVGDKMPDSGSLAGMLKDDRMAGLRNKVAAADTWKQMRDAQLKLLAQEREDILSSTEVTGERRLEIIRQFAERAKEIEDDYKEKIVSLINEIGGYIDQALSIMSTFNQARTNIENNALKREQQNNEKRKKDLENTRAKGLLTENEYRIKVAKMDEELDNKKRKLEAEQFERKKKQDIAQALINGALGITAAWVKPGFPLAILYTALIAANTAAQIGLISSQKPQFKDGGMGGIAEGPSHGSSYGQSGISLVRRDTGEEVGEMEGGEPWMILSRKFRQNNPGLIPLLLHASRTGRTLFPSLISRPYTMGLNYDYINRSNKMFRDGGIVGSSSQSNSDFTTPESNERMQQLLEQLLNVLQYPLSATISHKQIEDDNQLRSNVLQEAVLK